VHEVAGRAAPDARVVYVGNDPIVHVHANALLTGSGSTGIVLADLRDPAAILADPKLSALGGRWPGSGCGPADLLSGRPAG
jgi:hypothetical protein